MDKLLVLFFLVPLLNMLLLGQAYGDGKMEPERVDKTWRRNGPAGGLFGLNAATDTGIQAELNLTQLYQQNVHGGLSTHRRAGRFSGSYDLEITTETGKLLGIEYAILYLHAEGAWSKSQGINDPAVGSFFGVNGDAQPRRSLDITELWYEQAFAAETLRVRIGKIDLTGGLEHHNCPVSFDCSAYANDENTQFLNNALINNPTIAFPDYGLGIVVLWTPSELWYVSAATADAEADFRKSGFDTTFDGDDEFFYILEAGLTPQFDSAKGPLQSAYRIGLWLDRQDKQDLSTGRTHRDNAGFYITFDQLFYKENSDPEDTQGLGAFARYGLADEKVNEVAQFWSVGIQYRGILAGRDDDVLALGFAKGIFSDRSDDFTDDYESVWELYYRAQLTTWAELSPSVQYITNPGGDGAADDALVVAARLRVSF